MRKILLIVALVVSLGVAGSMFAGSASAFFGGAGCGPVVGNFYAVRVVGAGPAWCGPAWCGPVYWCYPAYCPPAAVVKPKAAAKPKAEKKEKKK